MATIIFSKVKDGIDGRLKKQAYTFLEKLQADDTLPGLHIEPIVGSVDSRVRTGKVNDDVRCVMFKITGSGEPVYVIHGFWHHDKANKLAERVQLRLNPINGVAEVINAVTDAASEQPSPSAPPTAFEPSQPAPDKVSEKTDSVPSSSQSDERPTSSAPEEPAAQRPAWPSGLSVEELVGLGIEKDLATAALAAPDEAALADLVASATVTWQGYALLDLATGKTVDDIKADYDLRTEGRHAIDAVQTQDSDLLEGLRTTAARAAFHWVDDNAELRRVIDTGDFGDWRIFLHPEQRKYVQRDYSGPARVSGGAGTGKTVVAVHRARALAAANPEAKVLLTTFTTNLAQDLAGMLERLDETVPQVERLGASGVLVKNLDAVAWAVVQRAGEGVTQAAADVLGSPRSALLTQAPQNPWKTAVDEAGADLPQRFTTPSFLAAEYAMVVLPHRVTNRDGYFRARRQGRGEALNRARRAEVWKVIEGYRENALLEGWADFEERAAVAARWLELSGMRAFDHVVVDEGQDLSPAKLQLLRALVPEGPNDLFIAEDSHQRIYGQKVVLSHVGIAVRGRSRRLTLNYRTTQQNLSWALGVLEGGDFTDLEGEAEKHQYMSARTGPDPVIRTANGANKRFDAVAELMTQWLPGDGDGRADQAETIAVLTRDQYERSQVVKALEERGIEVRAVDRGEVRPGRPLVMTMHRAKGLEFTHVVILGADDLAPSGTSAEDEAARDTELRRRSLLYVAATRARDVLAVVG